jgi:hypothetical protein
MKIAVPDGAADLPAPPLRPDMSLSWPELVRVTEAFERVLLDVSLDISRRVAACVDLADLLRQAKPDVLKDGSLGDFLDEAAAFVQEDAVSAEPRHAAPNGMVRMAFRQLLGVYGRIDQVGEKADLGRRLTTGIRMAMGKGETPSIRDGFPTAPFVALEESRPITPTGAAPVLERYLHTHLASMGFFGPSFYGRTYLDGINALLLTFPLACWFARAFALAQGLAELDAESAESAIMIVDHQHGVTPILDMPGERYRTNFLCERGTLRGLIFWYGG